MHFYADLQMHLEPFRKCISGREEPENTTNRWTRSRTCLAEGVRKRVDWLLEMSRATGQLPVETAKTIHVDDTR